MAFSYLLEAELDLKVKRRELNVIDTAVKMKFPRLQGLSSCRLIDNLDLKQDDDDKNVVDANAGEDD